ncbi:MlaD family protein [Magnetospira thiophila]
MRNNKVNYLLVGGFVLIILVGLIASLALLTGRTGSVDSYYTMLGNVNGIKFGTQVLYEGYIIGQVEDVTPVEEDGRMRFKVDLSVIEGWKIPDDSFIRPQASGLLAAKSLGITAGVKQENHKPGAQILSAESADMFAVMADMATTVGDLAENSLKPLLVSLQETVLGVNELVHGDGKAMIKDFREVALQVNTSLPAMVSDLQNIVSNIKAASADVRTMAGSADGMLGNVDQGVTDFRKMARNMAALSDELRGTRVKLDHVLEEAGLAVADNRTALNETVEDLRYSMDSVSRHIDSVNQNLEGAARNMNEFSRQIRQNPGLLLGGKPPTDEAAK